MTQKSYMPNIPEIDKKRIVIIGGGFAGLKFVQKSLCQHYQLVLLDKNNYHQFQPLLYQVATAGLEPSAISFPLRKVLQKEENIHYRLAEVQEILPESNSAAIKISLDIPTGFLGKINPSTFKASKVLTPASLKKNLLNLPAETEVFVADLRTPAEGTKSLGSTRRRFIKTVSFRSKNNNENSEVFNSDLPQMWP